MLDFYDWRCFHEVSQGLLILGFVDPRVFVMIGVVSMKFGI